MHVSIYVGCVTHMCRTVNFLKEIKEILSYLLIWVGGGMLLDWSMVWHYSHSLSEIYSNSV
jgi:hypothetical protein